MIITEIENLWDGIETIYEFQFFNYNVHEGHKDHKCEACGKLFSFRVNLKRHIHNIHKGHKDHKSESSVKSFTEEEKLK